jgi:hypothetical protein
LSCDPIGAKYPDLSPYNFVANQPIRAIDPDGKRILFVNGYNSSGILGDIISSKASGKGYWNAGDYASFEYQAQSFFNDFSGNSQWINGSSKWGGDQSGSDRYELGRKYAKENYKTLIEGMKEGEVFEIVAHSEGSAYGAGIASYLMEQGKTVKTIVNLSADEGDEYTSPKGPITYDLSFKGDLITRNVPVNGATKSGIVDKFTSPGDRALYAHADSKMASVFKFVSDLVTVQSEANLDSQGNTFFTQKASTAPNGSIFTDIDHQHIQRLTK